MSIMNTPHPESVTSVTSDKKQTPVEIVLPSAPQSPVQAHVNEWATLSALLSPKSLYANLDDALSGVSIGHSADDSRCLISATISFSLWIEVGVATDVLLDRHPELRAFVLTSIQAATQQIIAYRGEPNRFHVQRISFQRPDSRCPTGHHIAFVPVTEQVPPPLPMPPAPLSVSKTKGVFHVISGIHQGKSLVWNIAQSGYPRLPRPIEADAAWRDVEALRALLVSPAERQSSPRWPEGTTQRVGGSEVCFTVLK